MKASYPDNLRRIQPAFFFLHAVVSPFWAGSSSDIGHVGKMRIMSRDQGRARGTRKSCRSQRLF